MQLLKNIFENRKILIAGFGREGRSSYRTIRALLPRQPLAIADRNTSLADDALIADDRNLTLHLGDGYLKPSDRYDIILKSPGIPTFDFEGIVGNPDKISSQADIFLQLFHNQTIGITGTKGKSTTTNLLHKVLLAHTSDVVMAGNMGIPLFDTIGQIGPETLLVLELSSHQLENVHTSPHVSILLNLYQEHLDHYHSFLDYQLAKMNIAKYQTSEDFFICCFDNGLVRERVSERNLSGEVLPYSLERTLEKGCCKNGDAAVLNPSGKALYDTSKPRCLQGDHNLLNIMAVSLAAHCLGMDGEETENAINTFTGLEHRLEFVTRKNGITFYNDSISTIPEACMAAVGALRNVDTLILGGFDRGIDYSALSAFLDESEIGNLVFVGEAGKRILGGMRCSDGKNILVSNDYRQIVDFCFASTAEGKTCLLSPAAASYDQFKNFEERGSVFKKLISEHM